MPSPSPLRSIAAMLALAVPLAACADGEDPTVDRAATVAVEPTTTTSASTTEPPTTTTLPATTTTTAAPVDIYALRPPTAAGDPAGLAAQIVAAETALRDPATDEVQLATASLLQQVAYRQLGTRPEWDAVVVELVPPELRSTVVRNAAARREFRGMHRKLSPTLPAWRIVAPEPAEVLLAAYQEAEATFGIPWRYLAAINLVETATGRIRGTSVAGAQGPMQFMPATWDAYGAGGDVNDTRDAIMGAARYLAANNGGVDIDQALYRYNRSERYVRGVKLYADLIAEHPRGFRAFHGWGVWYLTDQGDVYLPVGYESTTPIPVADYRPT